MKIIRLITVFATLLALVSELCFGRQVRLTQSEALRYMEEGDPRGEVLNAVTILPAGTVIEVDDDGIDPPVMAPYTCDSLERGPCDPAIRLEASHGFAHDIRVISMPDRTPADRAARARYKSFISRFPDADLYFSESSLARLTRPLGRSERRILTGRAALFGDPTPPARSEPGGVGGGAGDSPEGDAAREAGRLPTVLAGLEAPASSCRQEEAPPPPRPISPIWSRARGCALTIDNFRERITQILAGGVPFAPLRQAVDYYLQNCSRLPNKRYLTIVDYDLPSSMPRLFLVDLASGSVRRELVSHGTASGNPYWATSFSNANDSHSTSLGFYLTREVIYGQSGRSMKLQGLSHGLNDLAYERSIEIHGLSSATPEFVASHGYTGETWGCFGVDPRDLGAIFGRIGGGSLFYAYQSRSTPPDVLSRTIAI